MKSVMLYFGSFNPVHKGHIAIAEYVLDEGLCDEVWLVVSPRNPLKSPAILLGENERLEMVKIAIAGSCHPDRIRACDIEFKLPKPSYTIDTLKVLDQLNPGVVFTVLFGSDVTGQLELWKDWRKLLNNYRIYVYPRRGYATKFAGQVIELKDAPYFDYSSTGIREALARGDDPEEYLSPGVFAYIKQNKLWM